MNGFYDFKKIALMRIRKLEYKVKILTLQINELLKKEKITNEWLSNSRERNAKILAENFKLKKLIAGYEKKDREGDLTATVAYIQMEMPKGLNKNPIKNFSVCVVKP